MDRTATSGERTEVTPEIQRRASKLVANARWRSKKKNLPCTITPDWVAEKIAANRCESLGLPFDLNKHGHLRRNPFAPSLSRRDHRLGYTPENVEVTCSCINIIRSDIDEQTLILVAMQYLRRKGLTS